MAYISKQEVQAKSIKLKEICKKYGIKARFSGSNSSTLKLKITAGKIDFIANYVDCLNNSRFYDIHQDYQIAYVQETKYIGLNHYYLDRSFCGIALECLQEIYRLMNEGHWDDSDIQTDYFSCSWYNSMQIGEWNKPYEVTE